MHRPKIRYIPSMMEILVNGAILPSALIAIGAIGILLLNEFVRTQHLVDYTKIPNGVMAVLFSAICFVLPMLVMLGLNKYKWHPFMFRHDDLPIDMTYASEPIETETLSLKSVTFNSLTQAQKEKLAYMVGEELKSEIGTIKQGEYPLYAALSYRLDIFKLSGDGIISKQNDDIICLALVNEILKT